MAKATKTIDVTHMPDALKIAEEVSVSEEPRVLRRDSEDLALVVPLRRRRPSPRGKVFTKDDPLTGLIGIGRSGLSDISENKHKYLAEAYHDKRR